MRSSIRLPAMLLIAVLADACAASPSSSADAASPISESEYLSAAGGASLFLDIRGEDRRAPLLLWLHGGPGGAERPLFRYFNGALERRFVVAYWDQRGAGHSFDPDAAPASLTVDQHLADLDLVVRHLTGRFGRSRVILVGHSWGSALGFLYAHRHPDRVAAAVGVAQFVSGRAAQQGQYQFVVEAARRESNDRALSRIEAIGPPPFDAGEVLDVQALVDEFGGYFHQPPNRWMLMLKGFFGGYVAPWDLPGYFRGNNVSLSAMHDELLALDLRERVPELDVPVIMMLGRYDHQLDATLAERYFESLKAPAKRLVWFEASAHNIPFEQPQAFDERLIKALGSVGVLDRSAG